MHVFGIDVGYNQTKVTDGEKIAGFPSVVGTIYQRRFAGLNGGNGEICLNTPRKVIVGDAAIQFSRFASMQRNRQWLQTDDWLDLFYAGMSEITPENGQCRIVTGLPVKYYQDKEIILPRLKTVHSFSRAGRSPQVWNVSECHVLMQPVGTLLRECLDAKGAMSNADMAKGHTAVIDVGGLTTNFCHTLNLRPIEHECTHEDQGGWSVVAMVREYIEQTYPGLNLRDHEIAQAIIDKSLHYEGESKSLSAIVDDSASSLCESLCKVAESLWSIKKLNTILITGGGSLLLHTHIQRRIPRAVVVKHPVTANVEGYYRYGLFQENKGK